MQAHRIILVAIILLILGGCQSNAGLQSLETVKIGVLLPAAGDAVKTGQDFQAGVEFALDIVNTKMDLPLPLSGDTGLSRHGGRKLQAVYRQSDSQAATAVQAATELFAARVYAILSALSDEEAIVVSERLEVMGLPFLNCRATASRLSQRGFQWFFQLNPDDTSMVESFWRFLDDLTSQDGVKVPRRMTLVYDQGLRGVGVARAGRQAASRYRNDILAEIPYNAQEPALPALALANRRFLHDEVVLLQAVNAQQADLWLQAWKSQGIRPKAILILPFGGDAADFDNHAMALSEQVFGMEDADAPVLCANQLQGWVAYLFRQRFGRELTNTAATAATATLVLADAMNRAPQLHRGDLREALLQTDMPAEQLILPWSGIKFHAQTGRNLLATAGIWQHCRKGRQIVWPRELAAAPVTWAHQPAPVGELQP